MMKIILLCSAAGNPEIIRLLARKALENDSGFVSECELQKSLSNTICFDRIFIMACQSECEAMALALGSQK